MKRVLLYCLLLCFLSVPIQVQAQSTEITITQNKIESDFPETILFQVEAEADLEIERIILRYGTNGRSCQDGGSLQIVSFDPGTNIAAEWEWELRRSGALPPGAAIWWQWEIEDTAGHATTTERQEYVVADDSRDWQSLTQDGVTVSWYLGDTQFGRAMLNQTLQSLEHLQTNLGLPQPETVDLWFYESGSAVQDAIVNVPEWTGGVAFPEYGVTVLGVAPDQEGWAAEIVPHELTHLLEGIQTFNCRGIRLPTWLTEGLARYGEGVVDESEVNRLLNELADESLPPLKSLSSGFSAYSDGAGLAYTQSGQVVAYLVSLAGPEKISELLDTMQQGSDIDDALLSVYGMDTDGLDAAWRNSLGYAPTPTSAADAAALAATATPVPTIALGGIPQSGTAVPEPSATFEPTATKTAVATMTPAPSQTPPPTDPPETSIPEVTEAPVTTPVTNSEPPAEQAGLLWLWLVIGFIIVSVVIVIFLKWQKSRG